MGRTTAALEQEDMFVKYVCPDCLSEQSRPVCVCVCVCVVAVTHPCLSTLSTYTFLQGSHGSVEGCSFCSAAACVVLCYAEADPKAFALLCFAGVTQQPAKPSKAAADASGAQQGTQAAAE